MVLYTKSIFDEKSFTDGTRISVMSRHTLQDGVTPDPRITDESYQLWMPKLAPPAELVGGYYKRGLPWADFGSMYLAHLQQRDIAGIVADLAKNSVSENMTLLCVEPRGENCHRLILAEACRAYIPDLRIEHR